MIRDVKDWISYDKKYKHSLGFSYELYINKNIPKKKIDSICDLIGEYMLKNYISLDEWNAIKENPEIKDISEYIKEKYIPSNTGNFGLKTGEFGEIIARLVFEKKYEFILYRFQYKEYKDEAVKIYDLVGFKIENGVINEIVLFEVKAQSNELDEEIIAKATQQIYSNITSKVLKYINYIEKFLNKNRQYQMYKMINDYYLNNIKSNNFAYKLKVTLVCEKSIYDNKVLDNLKGMIQDIDTNIFEVAIILLDDMKSLRDISYLKCTQCYKEVFDD